MFQTKTMSAIIKELKIKNFKGFKEEKVIDFSKLTILTGANSSGKSSVMNAILGLIQSTEFPFKFSTNGKYVNMGDFNDISNRHQAKEISLSLKFFISELKRECSFNTMWANDPINSLPEIKSIEFITIGYCLKVYNESGTYFFDFSYNPKLDPDYSIEKAKEMQEEVVQNFKAEMGKKFKKVEDYNKHLNRLKAYTSSMYKRVNLKKVEIGNDIDELPKSIAKKRNLSLDYVLNGLIRQISKDFESNINVISSFRLHPDRTYLEKSKDKLKIDKFGDGYLDQIILWEKRNKDKIEELTKILKKMTLVESIESHRIEGGRFEVMIQTKRNGTKTSLFDVGFGISQFLPIIVADLQLDENSTLFVAEPEIHLHPNVQAEFGEYLVEQVKNKKNYIIETHSEYLLNRIRLAIIKGTLKESDLAVYYLDNNGKDIKIYNLKFTKSGAIKNAPESFFDTYLMDLKDIALSAEL